MGLAARAAPHTPSHTPRPPPPARPAQLIKGRTHYLPEETVKIYMYQLMKAVDHMHRHGIFHR